MSDNQVYKEKKKLQEKLLSDLEQDLTAQPVMVVENAKEVMDSVSRSMDIPDPLQLEKINVVEKKDGVGELPGQAEPKLALNRVDHSAEKLEDEDWYFEDEEEEEVKEVKKKEVKQENVQKEEVQKEEAKEESSFKHIGLSSEFVKHRPEDSPKMKSIRDAVGEYLYAMAEDNKRQASMAIERLIKACDSYKFGKFEIFKRGTGLERLREVNQLREQACKIRDDFEDAGFNFTDAETEFIDKQREIAAGASIGKKIAAFIGGVFQVTFWNLAKICSGNKEAIFNLGKYYRDNIFRLDSVFGRKKYRTNEEGEREAYYLKNTSTSLKDKDKSETYKSEIEMIQSDLFLYGTGESFGLSKEGETKINDKYLARQELFEDYDIEVIDEEEFLENAYEENDRFKELQNELLREFGSERPDIESVLSLEKQIEEKLGFVKNFDKYLKEYGGGADDSINESISMMEKIRDERAFSGGKLKKSAIDCNNNIIKLAGEIIEKTKAENPDTDAITRLETEIESLKETLEDYNEYGEEHFMEEIYALDEKELDLAQKEYERAEAAIKGCEEKLFGQRLDAVRDRVEKNDKGFFDSANALMEKYKKVEDMTEEEERNAINQLREHLADVTKYSDMTNEKDMANNYSTEEYEKILSNLERESMVYRINKNDKDLMTAKKELLKQLRSYKYDPVVASNLEKTVEELTKKAKSYESYLKRGQNKLSGMEYSLDHHAQIDKEIKEATSVRYRGKKKNPTMDDMEKEALDMWNEDYEVIKSDTGELSYMERTVGKEKKLLHTFVVSDPDELSKFGNKYDSEKVDIDYDVTKLDEDTLKDMWKDIAARLNKPEGYIPKDAMEIAEIRSAIFKNAIGEAGVTDFYATRDKGGDDTGATFKFLKQKGLWEHYKLMAITQRRISFLNFRKEHIRKRSRKVARRSVVGEVELKKGQKTYEYESQGATQNCFACSLSAIYNYYVTSKGEENAPKLDQYSVRGFVPRFLNEQEFGQGKELLEAQINDVKQYAGKESQASGSVPGMSDVLFDKKEYGGMERNDIALVSKTYGLNKTKDKTVINNMVFAINKEIHTAIESGQMVSLLSHGHYITIVGILNNKIQYIDSVNTPEDAQKVNTMDLKEYLATKYAPVQYTYSTVEISYIKKLEKDDFDKLKKEYGGMEKDEKTGEIIRGNGLITEHDAAHRAGIVINKSEDEIIRDGNADIVDFMSDSISLNRKAFL